MSQSMVMPPSSVEAVTGQVHGMRDWFPEKYTLHSLSGTGHCSAGSSSSTLLRGKNLGRSNV